MEWRQSGQQDWQGVKGVPTHGPGGSRKLGPEMSGSPGLSPSAAWLTPTNHLSGGKSLKTEWQGSSASGPGLACQLGKVTPKEDLWADRLTNKETVSWAGAGARLTRFGYKDDFLWGGKVVPSTAGWSESTWERARERASGIPFIEPGQ